MKNETLINFCISGDDKLVIEVALTIQKLGHNIALAVTDNEEIHEILESYNIPSVSQGAFEKVHHNNNYDFLMICNRNYRENLIRLHAVAKKPILQYFEGNELFHYENTGIPNILLHGETRYAMQWAFVNHKSAICPIEKIKFEIRKDETSGSIIEKCLYFSIQIIEKIITFLPNIDLSNLEYQTINTRLPFKYDGIVDWSKKTDEIDLLFRAFNFKPFHNPYTLLKLLVNDEIFIIRSLDTQHDKQSNLPGEILSFNDKEITVACANGRITINEFTATSKKKILIEPGMRARNLSKEKAQEIQETVYAKTKNEYQLLNTLSKQPTPSPYFESLSKKPSAPYPKETPIHNLDHHERSALKLAIALTYIRLISQDETIIAAIYKPINTKDNFYKNLISERIPFSITIKKKDLFERVFKLCKKIFSEIDENHFSQDLLPRTNWTNRWDERWATKRIPIQFYINTEEEQQKTNQGLVFYIDNKANLKFSFNTNLLNSEEKTVICNQIAEHLHYLSTQIVENKKIPINKLTLLTEETLESWRELNKTKEPLLKKDLIIDIFKNQAKKVPRNIAIIDNEKSITYEELDIVSDRIAATLQENRIGTEEIISLLIERGIEFIAAVLGAIKSGCIYSPINPENPKNRISAILKKTSARFILTTKEQDQKDYSQRLIFVEDFFQSNEIKKPEIRHSLNDIAYVIFTSGSTGEPKGVKIKRLNLLNLIYWYINQYELKENTKTTMSAGVGFDACILEIFPALCSGSTISIIPQSVLLSPNDLIKWLEKSNIDLAFLPTSIVNLILKKSPEKFNHPISILTGGDRLNVYNKEIKNLRLFNLYGPTENTVVTSQQEVKPTQEKLPSVGRPIKNSQVFIFNDTLMPPGTVGEILISGDNLFSGYLNLNKETNAALREIKFENETLIAYKSGDLARLLPNGMLDFIKRKDKQINVRGFRVEIGEIEKAIFNFKMVRQAVVIAEPTDDLSHRLLAFIVPKGTVAKFNLEKLKKHLKDNLPHYMIPSSIFVMDKLPLNFSQKIDKKQLSSSVLEPESAQTIHVELTADEKQLSSLLESVLYFDPKILSREINFFELGLDSISAIHIIWKINDYYSTNITIAELYENANLLQLNKLVAAQQKIPNTLKKISALSLESAPLSYSQHSLWMFEKLNPGTSCYNIMCYCEIPNETNTKRLQESINQLTKRQRILLSCFKNENEQITRMSNITIDKLSCDDTRVMELIEQITKKPFDLTQAPLFRASIIKTQEKSYFCFCIHHILFDGWSLNVFCKEISAIYNRKLLEPLKIDYFDYCQWETNSKQKDIDIDRLSYWKNLLSDYAPIALFIGNKKAVSMHKNGETLTKWLSSIHLTPLEEVASKQKTTLFNILLSAYIVLIYKLSDINDIMIGCINFNRELPQTQSLIGYFANLVPIRTKLEIDKSLEDLFNNQHSVTRSAFDNAIPYTLLAAEIAKENPLLRQNLLQTVFTYQVESEYQLKLGDKKSTPFNLFYMGSKFNISLSIRKIEDALEISFEYSTALFDKDFIEKFSDNYIRLLAELPNSTQLNIQDITIGFSNLSPSRKAEEKQSLEQEKTDKSKTQSQSLFEKSMLAVWEAVLGQAINIDSNFFDVGGHSILAITLIEKIEHVFFLSISFDDIILHPTVKELCQHLDNLKETHAPIFELKKDGSKTPLFLIHPVGGTIFWYLKYASYLDDRPLYAIQDPTINNPEVHFESIESIAKYYFNLIKATQPTGPYLLGGASSGSNIASEIIHLLRENNDVVLSLVSFDGWCTYPEELKQENFLKKALEDRYEQLKQQLQAYRIKNRDRWLDLQLQRAELMKSYEPRTVKAPLILLKASELMPIFNKINIPDNYWSRHIDGPVIIKTVPGTHETMHYEPNCEITIEKLNEAFDELNI